MFIKFYETTCLCLLLGLTYVNSQKLKLCTVDGKGAFKKSEHFCPALDHPDSKAECVLGIDRLDCLRQISKGKADFAVFTPEDLVTATNSEIEVLITNELRYTKEEHEYQVVAIFRDSIGIQNKHDLKDKRFCHPGYGYETDWTTILSNYLEASVIPQSCITKYTLTENNIKASSEFFKSACKAGPWVNNALLDQELKTKYPNLCELCDSPMRCETSDKYWGRRGLLFCLTDGAGDVSWARLDDVRVHFGMAPGGAEASPEGYSFLCPDGTTKPLNSSHPCVWVVKPWPVIATKRTAAQKVQDLMSTLKINGTDTWQTNLLNLIENFHVSIINLNPIEPIESYLEKATGFLNANSFAGCHPPRTIRICTTSILENAKCSWLRESAAVYGVQPDLDCLKADNTTHCMDAVNRNAADIVMVPPDLYQIAMEKYHLESLFYETVNDHEKYLTVAVTRNGTVLNGLEDLRGLRGCFPYFNGVAWNTLVARLHEKNLLNSCPLSDALMGFLGSSCSPGSPHSTCDGTFYQGEFGALRCLMDGKGDVAFLSKNSITEFVHSQQENKSGKYKLDSFNIFCERKSEGCHLSWAPLGQGMVRSDSSDLWLKDTLDVFLQLDNLFGKNYKSITTPLQLYGPFTSKSNILFHDKTVRLRDVPTRSNIDIMPRNYQNMMATERTCPSSSTVATPVTLSFLLSYIVFVLF